MIFKNAIVEVSSNNAVTDDIAYYNKSLTIKHLSLKAMSNRHRHHYNDVQIGTSNLLYLLLINNRLYFLLASLQYFDHNVYMVKINCILS